MKDYELKDFLDCASQNVQLFCGGRNEDFFAPAVRLIVDAADHGNRVHIMGIGKPNHVAGYGAALMSSISVPAYHLDGTEVVHGSAGQLREGDVVICLSNSGETTEMRSALMTVKQNGAKIIGVSRDPDSYLAGQSDVHLIARAEKEGGPLNRAPMSSVLLECLVLQGLSVCLEMHYGLTPQEYVKRHPGGKLGQLRDGER